MKKLLLFLLLITGLSNAQIVNIPDANFKNKLIATGIDTNSDGNIQQSEALAVTSLGVANSNISDLTGINAFQNIISLNCSNNSITSLTISIPGLLVLVCQHNLLSSINFSGCTSLSNFDASYNQLTSLDFSNTHNVGGITAEENLLTSINLTGCSQLYWLHLAGNNLSSINLAGLSNLHEIIAPYNQITSLNVSSLNALTRIHLGGNNLTSLNTSGLPNLTGIEINNNPNMTSLNVDNCPLLYMILADNCGISSFTTSGCTSLYQVSMQDNGLSSVSFNNLPNLYILDLDFSDITEITFANCPTLHLLNLRENNFETLDVSSCLALDYLHVENNPNLVSLFIKNGLNEYLYIQNTPNLVYVCADENQIESVMLQANPNTVVSSYCSFVDGGNYNTISGVVTFDLNNNGCEASDNTLQSVRINLNDGVNQGAVFTNSNGNYSFTLQQGNFIITPSVQNPSWFNFSPTSSTISFANNNNNTSIQNFCISPIGVHNDVEVTIVPILVARPGFDASYQIIYRNKGNQTLSGNVNLTYEDDVLDFMSSTVLIDAQSAGSLTWDYTNLMPFETRVVSLVFNVNSPMETPAVNIGDQLDFTATINPISGDETPLDNVFGLKQIVVGSFDPNDKTCLEGSVVSTSKIGDYLHYNINFENTGTFPATFVVVKDMIDTAKFNVSTLQVLNASHSMETRIAGNKVEFIFDDINLGSNQHGNVVFKIKTKSTLVAGNTVTNNANIYFDYNFPIETNTTSTTFQTLSNGEFPTDHSVVIAPNPTKNTINVNCNNTIQSVQLFDVQGRVLMTQIVSDTQSSIDVSNYTNGIYFVKVITENGAKIEKIIKE